MRTVAMCARPIVFVCVITAVTVGAATVQAAGKFADHGLFTPAKVPWKDGPASLPSGSQVAVLEGSPAEPGLFTIRLKFPDGYRIPPHWHPAIERITVITGTFHLGMGAVAMGAVLTLLVIPDNSYVLKFLTFPSILCILDQSCFNGFYQYETLEK